MLWVCCETRTSDRLMDAGVSRELAQYREDNYQDVTYYLQFAIPQQKEQAVEGEAEIVLRLEQPSPLVADFRVIPCPFDRSVSMDVRFPMSSGTNICGSMPAKL